MADFKLGRLKFVWKGNWVTATAYVKDDIVRSPPDNFIIYFQVFFGGLTLNDIPSEKGSKESHNSKDASPP